MQRILLDDVLTESSKKQLTRWMVADETGDNHLRAGLPDNWRVGDKIGSGGNNTANDIAIIWPKPRESVLVTAYYTDSLHWLTRQSCAARSRVG